MQELSWYISRHSIHHGPNLLHAGIWKPAATSWKSTLTHSGEYNLQLYSINRVPITSMDNNIHFSALANFEVTIPFLHHSVDKDLYEFEWKALHANFCRRYNLLTCTALLRKQLFSPGPLRSPFVLVKDMLILGFHISRQCGSWSIFTNVVISNDVLLSLLTGFVTVTFCNGAASPCPWLHSPSLHSKAMVSSFRWIVLSVSSTTESPLN